MYDIRTIPAEMLKYYAAAFYVGEFLNAQQEVSESIKMNYYEVIDELYLFMKNYGLYVVGREIRHTDSKITMIDNCPFCKESDAFDKELCFQYGLDPDIERMECCNCDKECLTDSIMGRTLALYDPEEFTEYMEYMQEHECAFSDPHSFLKDTIQVFNDYDWEDAYGGEQWAKISKTVNKFDSLPKASFIDCCWHLQHNSGSWFNKLDRVSFRDIKQINMILDIKFRHPSRFLLALSTKLLGKEVLKYRYLFEQEPNYVQTKIQTIFT